MKTRLWLLCAILSTIPTTVAAAPRQLTLNCDGSSAVHGEISQARMTLYLDLERRKYCYDTCERVYDVAEISADKSLITLYKVVPENEVLFAYGEINVNLKTKKYHQKTVVSAATLYRASSDMNCEIKKVIAPNVQETLSRASD